MKLNFRLPVSAAIAIAVGIIVLLGYFVDLPSFSLFSNLREIFLLWAVLLAAVALLVGVANLAQVHWNRITNRQPGSGYSAILILSLLGTILVAGVFGPTHPWSLWLFNYVHVPAESSLLAILSVVLIYGVARVLGRKMNIFTVVFLGIALLVLLGTASLPGIELPIFSQLRAWIGRVPAVAGARGILLGVALGTVATGLRVLIGVDRPYGR